MTNKKDEIEKYIEEFEKNQECKWHNGNPIQYMLDKADLEDQKVWLRTTLTKVRQEAYEQGKQDMQKTCNSGRKMYELGREDERKEIIEWCEERCYKNMMQHGTDKWNGELEDLIEKLSYPKDCNECEHE